VGRGSHEGTEARRGGGREVAALPPEIGDGSWEMGDGGSRLKAGVQNGERGVAALPLWGNGTQTETV
jgi:hypothetical protein